MLGLPPIVDVLQMKNGENKCITQLQRTDLLDLSLTVTNGKIITWFCKLMRISLTKSQIVLVTDTSLSNQASRLIFSLRYYYSLLFLVVYTLFLNNNVN
jgi:hypothetical protein